MGSILEGAAAQCKAPCPPVHDSSRPVLPRRRYPRRMMRGSTMALLGVPALFFVAVLSGWMGWTKSTLLFLGHWG